MSKLMELADAYASLQSEVEYLQDQGTTNQMATVYPAMYRKYEEARATLAAAVEKLEKDAARYRWMREYLPSDDTSCDEALVAALTPEELDAAIDAAMEASK